MDAAALIPLAIKGISKLRTRYKNIKINEKERASLEGFIDTINGCIKEVGASSSSSSTKQKLEPLPLVKTLTKVQKTLDEWSSEESVFFRILTVTARTEKMEDLKREVDRVVQAHMLSILKRQDERQERQDERQERLEERQEQFHVWVANHLKPPVKDSKGTSTRDPRPSNKGEPHQRRSASAEPRKPPVKDSKGTSIRDPRPSNKGEPHQRRSASVEPRKVPCENQDVGPKHQTPRSNSNHQGPIHPHGSRHHEPRPKTLEPSKVHPKHREVGPKDSNHHEPSKVHPKNREVGPKDSHRHEPSKVHSKTRELGPKDSNQQGSRGSTHHQTKRETHTWVCLWAPLDSEKQAKDVKDKLENIQDVKVEEVSCDQPINKVMVKVKAVKDDSQTIQILLRETRAALTSSKALPTLWDNRPK